MFDPIGDLLKSHGLELNRANYLAFNGQTEGDLDYEQESELPEYAQVKDALATMRYKGETVKVLKFGVNTSLVVTDGGDEFWAKTDKLQALTPKKPKLSREERLRRPEDVSEDFVNYLREAGVSIRVYCAAEHVGILTSMLEYNGSSLPAGFESSDTHSRGGEYRPYAPGIICIFPAPEVGRFSTPFSLTAGGEGHIARTSFGLKLISSGFPITTWKGQKSNVGGSPCLQASL